MDRWVLWMFIATVVLTLVTVYLTVTFDRRHPRWSRDEVTITTSKHGAIGFRPGHIVFVGEERALVTAVPTAHEFRVRYQIRRRKRKAAA